MQFIRGYISFLIWLGNSSNIPNIYTFNTSNQTDYKQVLFTVKSKVETNLKYFSDMTKNNKETNV